MFKKLLDNMSQQATMHCLLHSSIALANFSKYSLLLHFVNFIHRLATSSRHYCSLLLAALFGNTRYVKGVALQSWSLVAGMVVV